MGLFGGSKSKSTTNVTSSESTVADQRELSGDGQIVGGNITLNVANSTVDGYSPTGATAGAGGAAGINITQTDLGAIALGKDVALAGLETANSSLANAFDAARQSSAQASSAIDAGVSLIREKAETESEKLLKIAGVLGAIFVIGGTLVFIYGGKGR